MSKLFDKRMRELGDMHGQCSLLVLFLLLQGCSTLGQIGDIEGLGETGEVLRTIESSRVVLGGTPQLEETQLLL